MDGSPGLSRGRWELGLCLALLVAVGLGIYAPSLRLRLSPEDQACAGLVSASCGREFGPLAALSFAANRAAGGADPSGYRLFNLGVLLLASSLVLWLAREFFERKYPGRSSAPSLICACAFLLGPAQIESVLRLPGRSILMALCFCLLAWRSHLRRGPSLSTLALLSAGFLCDGVALAAPPFAWAWEACSERMNYRRHGATWPYLALAAGFAALRSELSLVKVFPPLLFAALAVLAASWALRRPKPLLSLGLLVGLLAAAPLVGLDSLKAFFAGKFLICSRLGLGYALGDLAVWAATPALAWAWLAALSLYAVVTGRRPQDWRARAEEASACAIVSLGGPRREAMTASLRGRAAPPRLEIRRERRSRTPAFGEQGASLAAAEPPLAGGRGPMGGRFGRAPPRHPFIEDIPPRGPPFRAESAGVVSVGRDPARAPVFRATRRGFSFFGPGRWTAVLYCRWGGTELWPTLS